MTKDEIIKLAREAGFERVVAIHPDGSKTVTVAPVLELEAFAALVAVAEREECAKLVDHILKEGGGTYADAIRVRGQS